MSRRNDLVNQGDFETLFLEELLWDRPDRAPLGIEVEATSYRLQQVAGYAGLRVWLCDQVPQCYKVTFQESEGNVAAYVKPGFEHVCF